MYITKYVDELIKDLRDGYVQVHNENGQVTRINVWRLEDQKCWKLDFWSVQVEI